jgi:hypothetical protein
MAIEFNFKGEGYEYTITVFDEEVVEYEEEADEENHADIAYRGCPVCHRVFASPGNLKQHRTVKGH